MKPLIVHFFTVIAINTLSAQTTNINHVLPASATEVTSNVSNTPGYMVSMQEGGNVPGEDKSTCDGNANGVFKSTVGLSLQHYYDPQQLKQMGAAYASIGGMKGVFIKGSETDYQDYDKGMRPGPILKKGPLLTEESQGATVSYFTITYGCVQSKNPSATRTIYKAMLVTEDNYVLITNEIYSVNAELARKYADEMITKIKSLDYRNLK